MEEKRASTFGHLYGLIKAFLKDFYKESKEGTIRHKSGVTLFLAFVFLSFVLVGVAAYKISETPLFCGLCHNMKVYVDSWKASTHRHVGCIDCHYKPGLMSHLKGKWRDGQLSMAYFITGKRPTRPHAEIEDASCLQRGCHSKSDLKNPIVFKNVAFSHPSHVEQMRRQKQLRCTTCHSQIVQGAHMTVTDVECYICHFYKTKDQKGYVTGCGSCHFEARGDIKVSADFTFNHKRYIGRGIKCDQCHTNVVSGDGHIAENACLQCHNKREILEAKYTAEVLHKKHVTDHKVECFTCHSPIKHQTVGLHFAKQAPGACADCHPSGLHGAKVAMYLGKGAAFVKERPNRMALINMDCAVCHDRTRFKSPTESCKTCHGTLAEGMVTAWKKMLREKQAELSKEMTLARAAVEQRPDNVAKKRLADAVSNADFIAGASAIHNVVYAVQVADATKKVLLQLQGRGPQKEEPAKVSCTRLCHTGIEERKVAFGSVTFPHGAHADGDDSCLKCHSPYAQHGSTTLKDCTSCHHGEGMGKVRCSDCHRNEAGMYSGKGVKGLKAVPDAMFRKVSCEQCHSSVKQGKPASLAVLKAACATCHGKEYATLVGEWQGKQRGLQATYGKALTEIEKQIAAIEAKDERNSVPLRAAYDEVNQDIGFVLQGKWAHNPAYSEAIVKKIEGNLETLRGMLKQKQAGKPIVLKSRQ